MSVLCKACAAQYAGETPPARCAICDDPRQYVPHDAGQVWVSWEDYLSSHEAEVRDDHGILGIGATPAFGIGERALLVETEEGNVLWDCIPYLDDALVHDVRRRGGLAGVAISHPHFQTAMVEWAHAFDCPVHVHAADREWIVRPDPAIRFWDGETLEPVPGVTLVRCGGHFEGSQALYWAKRRALLVGDTVQVVPDRRHVGFMRSYPNLIPLPPARVEAVAAALAPFEFESIYGGWWDRVVERDGSAVVRRSAERYVRAVGSGV